VPAAAAEPVTVAAPSRHIDMETVAKLARRLCRAPLAAVMLADSDRQWLEAIAGLDEEHTRAALALCVHTLLSPVVIEDVGGDARFAMLRPIAAVPAIRSYVGVPLGTDHGEAMGVLGV